MPLVNAKEMLTKAKAGHYAVGQFNINNLEWTKAVLLTAQELSSPVILGVSEGAGKYMCGYKTVVGMVNGMLDELNITVPVALHLDHGSYDGALKCIEAGFSSIMFDGSHYPIEENIEKTKELVKICEDKGLSIEAEVGSIGGEEDGVVGMGECADPQECKMSLRGIRSGDDVAGPQGLQHALPLAVKLLLNLELGKERLFQSITLKHTRDAGRHRLLPPHANMDSVPTLAIVRHTMQPPARRIANVLHKTDSTSSAPLDNPPIRLYKGGAAGKLRPAAPKY